MPVDRDEYTTSEAAAYRRGLAEGYERATAAMLRAALRTIDGTQRKALLETARAIAAMQPDTRDNAVLPRQSGDRHNQPEGEG